MACSCHQHPALQLQESALPSPRLSRPEKICLGESPRGTRGFLDPLWKAWPLTTSEVLREAYLNGLSPWR